MLSNPDAPFSRVTKELIDKKFWSQGLKILKELNIGYRQFEEVDEFTVPEEIIKWQNRKTKTKRKTPEFTKAADSQILFFALKNSMDFKEVKKELKSSKEL